jgi:hypothetical protein
VPFRDTHLRNVIVGRECQDDVGRLDMQLKGGAVFTQIGWPQFLIIVVILVIGLLYSQRHRF